MHLALLGLGSSGQQERPDQGAPRNLDLDGFLQNSLIRLLPAHQVLKRGNQEDSSKL